MSDQRVFRVSVRFLSPHDFPVINPRLRNSIPVLLPALDIYYFSVPRSIPKEFKSRKSCVPFEEELPFWGLSRHIATAPPSLPMALPYSSGSSALVPESAILPVNHFPESQRELISLHHALCGMHHQLRR